MHDKYYDYIVVVGSRQYVLRLKRGKKQNAGKHVRKIAPSIFYWRAKRGLHQFSTAVLNSPHALEKIGTREKALITADVSDFG